MNQNIISHDHYELLVKDYPLRATHQMIIKSKLEYPASKGVEYVQDTVIRLDRDSVLLSRLVTDDLLTRSLKDYVHNYDWFSDLDSVSRTRL